MSTCGACGSEKDGYGCSNIECLGDEPIEVPELTEQEKLELVNEVWVRTPFPVRHFAARYAQLQRIVALDAPSTIAAEQRRMIREALVNMRAWMDEYEHDLGTG